MNKILIKIGLADRLGLNGKGVSLVGILLIITVVILCDKLLERQCNNYEKMTGRSATWVSFDACYVEKEDGKIIRYDQSYKE